MQTHSLLALPNQCTFAWELGHKSQTHLSVSPFRSLPDFTIKNICNPPAFFFSSSASLYSNPLPIHFQTRCFQFFSSFWTYSCYIFILVHSNEIVFEFYNAKSNNQDPEPFPSEITLLASRHLLIFLPLHWPLLLSLLCWRFFIFWTSKQGSVFRLGDGLLKVLPHVPDPSLCSSA